MADDFKITAQLAQNRYNTGTDTVQQGVNVVFKDLVTGVNGRIFVPADDYPNKVAAMIEEQLVAIRKVASLGKQ